MKINEVIQPSAKAIYESLKQDTDHTFSDDTLKQIAESASSAKFTKVASTLEEVDSWIESLRAKMKAK
jgi:hypothetical protein